MLLPRSRVSPVGDHVDCVETAAGEVLRVRNPETQMGGQLTTMRNRAEAPEAEGKTPGAVANCFPVTASFPDQRLAGLMSDLPS